VAEHLVLFSASHLNRMGLIRNPAYAVSIKLRRRVMGVFDNCRVMHGRGTFNPESGFRHLHACNVGQVDFDSQLRRLYAK
jgi:gamma-butyrobetaine dioxygenase